MISLKNSIREHITREVYIYYGRARLPSCLCVYTSPSHSLYAYAQCYLHCSLRLSITYVYISPVNDLRSPLPFSVINHACIHIFRPDSSVPRRQHGPASPMLSPNSFPIRTFRIPSSPARSHCTYDIRTCSATLPTLVPVIRPASNAGARGPYVHTAPLSLAFACIL